ncbi:MAG: DUF1294 domain-containing protein [Methanomassiliicoccales archaeon]|jgi:uncharacterized membrane protein YsdA (DUF1294 family)
MEIPFDQYVIPVLLVFNVVAFLLFGIDKSKARKDRRRISEGTLLLSALLGPFGAYLGMRSFHHKTNKLKFVLVPLFMLMHIAIWIYLAYLI